MAIALLIIGFLLGIACFSFLMYKLVKYVKIHNIGETESKIEGKDKLYFIGLVLAQGLFTIISSYGIVAYKNYLPEMHGGEHTMLIFGSYLFGTMFALLVSSFVIYYWKTDLNKKQRKISRICLFSSIPLLFVGLILFTEGFACHIPLGESLPNGISFTKGFVRPGESAGFTIKFYGIVIVCGALFPLFISDHMFYKKYKAHNIVDSLFIFSFIMGIIGARLWYCLILEPNTYLADPIKILKITEGGMAIQGGALLGIISGVAFVLIFRKYVDIRFAMDVAVPTILIAQAVGRWGNFFNQEVYGAALSDVGPISFLPTIIKNNLFINGSYRVPLFLIESCINLCGYFIIRYLCGKVFKCHTGLGYQASLYLVWYGIVRIVMEPLRNSSFEYNQSWITAFVMMGVGIALFVMFFAIHKIRMNKNLENAYGDKI